MQKIKLLLFLLGLATLPAGCSGGPEPLGGERVSAWGGRAPLQNEKPVFRVISGDETASSWEARTGAGRATHNAPLDSVTLDVVYFDELLLSRAAVALTEMVGQNVVVSTEAAKTKVRVYLKNVSGRAAVETICRLGNLWYREEGLVVRILTADEYARELIVRRDEQTRLFYLRYASARGVADMIAALMGEQVEYVEPEEESSYGHVGTEEGGAMDTTAGSGYRGGRAGSRDRGYKGSYGRRGANVRREIHTWGRGGRGDLPREIPREQVERVDRSIRESDKGEIAASELGKKLGRPAMVVLSVFPRNNCIAARSVDGSILREIGRIIEALDTPTRQVLLEVKILDITLTDDFESFFELTHTDTSTHGRSISRTIGAMNLPGIAGKTVSYVFLDNKIDAQLQMLDRDNRARSVATPLLMCANNAPAEFFVGEERPITTNFEFEVREFEQRTTEVARPVIELREIGTKVRIVPAINADGTVTLRFLIEVGTVNPGGAEISHVNDKGGVVSLPIDTVNSNRVETIVAALNGQTIVMGGLIRETIEQVNEQVPIIGSIPVLGFPFRKTMDRKRKTETVILITPHVVGHPFQAGAVSAEVAKDNSDHPYIASGQKHLLEYDDETGTVRVVKLEKPKKTAKSKNAESDKKRGEKPEPSEETAGREPSELPGGAGVEKE